MKLSIVIPAYNEEQTLPQFLVHLVSCLEDITQEYEIILVNDGSTDKTLEICHTLVKQNKRIRLVNLSRNFGKEIALTAGISQAMGEAVIMIDADGQHPPELIQSFVDLWNNGYQVVIGVRGSNQKEGIIKRYGSKLFYHLFNKTSGITLIPGATDFRLIDREVRDEFVKFTEHNRIARGLIDWMGYTRALVPFDANKRIAGKASYSIIKLSKLALNSFISLSLAPLYAIGIVGVLITFFASALLFFIFVEQHVLGDPLKLRITGTAILCVTILFFVGIIMISQGLIALYLSHIHTQTQNRPLFIIDKKNSCNIS